MKHLFACAAAALMAAAPSVADDDDKRRYRYGGIDRYAAMDIAAFAGVEYIKEIERDDGEWEIEGRTWDGCEIEVEIDSYSGRILDREIDDCDDGYGDDDDWDDDDDD